MARLTFNGWTQIKSINPDRYFTTAQGKRVYSNHENVRVIFAEVARRWHNEIEPIQKATYDRFPNERNGRIRVHAARPASTKVGTGGNSNHTSHTAMDINGDLHPYERTLTALGLPYRDGFTQAQRNTLRRIRHEITDDAGRPILRLGIDFPIGWRDGMHVEIAPGVSAARVKQAADKLRKASTPGKVTIRSFPASASRVGNKHFLSGLLQAAADRKNTGSITAADVTAFRNLQKQLGVTVDGILGPNSVRARIQWADNALARGDRGSAVALVQYACGVPYPEIDGIWGSNTDKHVKAAQRSARITADAIFGPNSRKAIIR